MFTSEHGSNAILVRTGLWVYDVSRVKERLAYLWGWIQHYDRPDNSHDTQHRYLDHVDNLIHLIFMTLHVFTMSMLVVKFVNEPLCLIVHDPGAKKDDLHL